MTVASKICELTSPTKSFLGHALITVAVVLILTQTYLARQDAARGPRAQPSPITFELPWETDRGSYRVGDLVTLTFTRETCESENSEIMSGAPLMVFTIDAFQRVGTDEVFDGDQLVRSITEYGAATKIAYRRIPDNLPPGRYSLVGWATAQTFRRTLPTHYYSNEFDILP